MTKKQNASAQSHLVVQCPSGHLEHYGALSIILYGDLDDWEQFGHKVIGSMAFWHDAMCDNMTKEDLRAFREDLERIVAHVNSAIEGE